MLETTETLWLLGLNEKFKTTMEGSERALETRKGEIGAGLVRDLNPGPLVPKARIIPPRLTSHTYRGYPPPLLPQVTPVTLPAIVQFCIPTCETQVTGS